MIKEYQPGGYYKIFPITGNRNAVVKFIPVNKNIYDYNRGSYSNGRDSWGNCRGGSKKKRPGIGSKKNRCGKRRK